MKDYMEDFVEDLEEEWPPGRWGFYVYLGYSNANAELYLLNETISSQITQLLVNEQIHNEDTRDIQPPTTIGHPMATLSNAFDRLIAHKLANTITNSAEDDLDNADAITDTLQLDYIRLPSSRPYEAREHFRSTIVLPRDRAVEDKLGAYRQSEGHGLRYQIFVLIDDECLEKMLGPAAAAPDSKPPKTRRMIAKACWTDYDNVPVALAGGRRGHLPGPVMHPYEKTFYGYMRVRIKDLWVLWVDVKMSGVQGFLHDTTVYSKEEQVVRDFYHS